MTDWPMNLAFLAALCGLVAFVLSFPSVAKVPRERPPPRDEAPWPPEMVRRDQAPATPKLRTGRARRK